MLLVLGMVFIVNENDIVVMDEICFGDNDWLVVQIVVICGVDQFLLLLDVDGFYIVNFKIDLVVCYLLVIQQIILDIEVMGGDFILGFSKGGMKIKLMVVCIVVVGGCVMVIVEGLVFNFLIVVVSGLCVSWFLFDIDLQVVCKCWIVVMKFKGEISVDVGVVDVLCYGKLLLFVGIIFVVGCFGCGDLVVVFDVKGVCLVVGLVCYFVIEVWVIVGYCSDEIEIIFGYFGCVVLIYCDDMVM